LEIKQLEEKLILQLQQQYFCYPHAKILIKKKKNNRGLVSKPGLRCQAQQEQSNKENGSSRRH
jgi:hypothetical protein